MEPWSYLEARNGALEHLGARNGALEPLEARNGALEPRGGLKWTIFVSLTWTPKRDPKMDPRKDPKKDPQKDPLKSQKCCNYNVFCNSGPPFRRLSGGPSRPNRVPPEGSIWDLFRGSENRRKHCIYKVWEAFRVLKRKPVSGPRKGIPKGPDRSPIGDPNWSPNRSPNRSSEGGPFGA